MNVRTLSDTVNREKNGSFAPLLLERSAVRYSTKDFVTMNEMTGE